MDAAFSPTSFAQGTTPTVTDVVLDGNGNVLDLSNCVTATFVFQGGKGTPVFAQTRTATITDAPNGGVSYTFQPGDINALGAYLCQWVLTFQDGSTLILPPASGVFEATQTNILMKWPDGTWHAVQRILGEGGQFVWDVDQAATPTGGWNEFTVVSAADVTPICNLYDIIRPMLGDFHPTEHLYEDETLRRVVLGVVKMGKLNILGPAFNVTPDNRCITPVLPNAQTMALAVLYSVRTILRPTMASSSYRTRAMSESFGVQRDYLWDLENEIWDVENPGCAVATFQSFYGWVNATTGLNIYALLTDFNNTGSVATVSLGRAGLQVATNM